MSELKIQTVTTPDDPYNPDDGDLWLSPAGDVVLETDMGRETAQRLKVRFSFFLGEWFLDLNQGTPYFQSILGQKNVPDRVIRALFYDVIENTEGVSQVVSFSYSQTRNRELLVTFTAKLVDGSTVRFVDYAPFTSELTHSAENSP